MTQETSLAKVVEESGLAPNQSQAILEQFSSFFKQAKEWENKARAIVVTDASQKDVIKSAREGRMALKQIRVNAEKARKQLKEKALREGRAIDGIANVIKALVVPIEQHLEEQEKFVERQEELKRQQILNDRTSRLAPFVDDVSVFNLVEMTDEGFNNLLKSSIDAQEAKKKAEEQAEKDRVAKEEEERAEAERIRAENEKLRAENEKREAEEKKLREEKEKAEALVRQKEEAERKAKEDAERKAAEEAKAKEEAEKKARLAPEKDKMLEYADRIDAVQLPEGLSKENQAIVEYAKARLDQTAQMIRAEMEKI